MAQLHASATRIEISAPGAAVKDPLFAKILAIGNGKQTAVVISLDYICMGGGIGELTDSFFPALKQRINAMGVDILVCGTTHTHTPGTMFLEEDYALGRICQAIEDLRATMEPVCIGYGTGHDNSFLINRTLKLRDGSAWSIRQAHPCPSDDAIDRLEFADDSIPILRIDRVDGSPLCVVFAFGCHPLLGYASNAVTANYPGVAERIVEEQTGAVAMLLQSCGGDVTEVTYKNYDIPKNCDGPGMSLGISVLRAWRSIQTESNVDFAWAWEEISFPRKDDYSQVRDALLAEREQLFYTLGNCPLNFKSFLPLYMKYLVSPEYPLDYAYAYMREEAMGVTQLRDQDAINRKNLEKYLENLKTMEKLSKIATTLETIEWHERYNAASGETHISGEVAGLRLGECLLVTAPVEPLSEIGRRIQALTELPVLLAGYANGYMHYGAPAEVYNNGGYETIECMLGSGWQAEYEAAVERIFQKLQRS